jgi:tetratricopeptide (TPR) repeat protein
MELSDELNEKIEAYLDASLDESAKIEFEQVLAASPELREELAFRKKTRRSIEALKFRQEFEKIRNTVPYPVAPNAKLDAPAVKPLFWPKYAVAASITLLLVAGILYRNDVFSPPGQRVFNKYYQAETYARGGCPQELPSFRLYADGRYQEALEDTKTAPTDSIFCTIYFKGLCYLAQDQSSHAIPLFNQAIESTSKEVQNKALWYLAMAYLEANDQEKAEKTLRKIASVPENPYSALAGEIISDFFSN